MELCAATRHEKRIPDGRIKECFEEYKLQDEVDALKTAFGIRDDSFDSTFERDRSVKPRMKNVDTTGVKDCLRPPVPSTFQVLVSELRDTVRSGYWNKEIGKTVYLMPHLPAGCDPLETTFGKATIRQEHGVAEILNPGNDNIVHTDKRAHGLYRKSHNDYDPSERVDRKYDPPFDKLSSFGAEKKRADFSGRKAARCLQWMNSEPVTLVSRRLADFSNRTRSRLGRVRNCCTSLTPEDFTFGKSSGEGVHVADVLREVSDLSERQDIYCSVYANEISRHCEPSREEIIVAGLRSDRSDVLRDTAPASVTRFEAENLGDQTSAQALVSPNVFTQLGLSHLEFFKPRDCKEMRSIFKNIGVEFPDHSFDVIWAEGLNKDSTGGVCVETFRNILGRLAMENYTNEQL